MVIPIAKGSMLIGSGTESGVTVINGVSELPGENVVTSVVPSG